jgi:hypothetical protein
MQDELRVRRVMDVRPADVLAVRARMLATGLAPHSTGRTTPA